ncbi:MAG: ROK family protein [Candidatus Omnitrophica bacterium]|jgi:glucokinase|nr:ROK family protein [Candidatus Omnitrophota bacterium]
MSKKYIIGIDLGGTNLKVALVGPDFKIKDRLVLSTADFNEKSGLIQAIIFAVTRIIASNQCAKSAVLGVGLGLPGPIDADKGLVHFFPNIPGWKEVYLKKILEQKIKLPVFIDNDANLMALAESRMGAAKGMRNAVCITLGTGVGGGIIIDNRLYRGSTFSAGEIGHMPVNEKGPDCNCSGFACLEAYIGNKKLLNQAKSAFGRQISLEELSRLSAKKNRKAVLIWERMAQRLGVVLSGIVNLLNPDCIVIGGGVANAGRIIFDQVKENILTRAMVVQAKHVKIVRARLGSDAGMIGAALLVKESV